MTSVSLEKYLQSMRTTSFTCNWDVAVSYDQQKINAALSDRYTQPGGSGMTTEVSIREKVEDRNGEYYQNYYFNLGPPLIQFEQTPAYPTCSLKTAIIAGSIWDSELDDSDTKENEKELDKDTYWITISNISLSALDGNADNVGGGDETVTFPSNVESDCYIVVDIPTSSEQLSFSVDYPSDYEPPYAMKTTALSTALKDFFKTNVNRVAYTLAQINNYKPTTGVLDLVPQAFRFVTYGVADSDISFLTLLIQTRTSSSPGDIKDVQSEWITNWSNTAHVAPVPSDQSASIIINNSFFFQTFIKPGLTQASSVTEVTIPSADSVGGLTAQCIWPTQTRGNRDYHNDSISTNWEHWPLDYEWNELHVPEVTYDPNNSKPLTLTFSHSNGFGNPATLHISWEYKYLSTWNGTKVKRYSIYDEGGIIQWLPSTNNYHGSFNTTYTLNKTIDLIDLTDEDLSISIAVQPSDWQTVVVPNEGDGFWGQISQIFGGSYDSGTIPSFVRDTTMDAKINFSFSFGTLRFFSVTNVLLPGEKVIEVNIKNGLGIPRDCVIVGNVVESSSKFISGSQACV
ncbi:hypothetical protein J3R30DRAFT_2874429 [Lentinula aciculospora]|uniref:Uncharacterized protein n=1 Tax=Lentinula aciculospora TaxID=153920 RepID=A0A9W9AAE5_9AGAR|nr:hypothetical protein J3R30DRAFT_2874429 [Lentinula aciculospora]